MHHPISKLQAIDNTPRALSVCRMDLSKLQAIDNTPRALGVFGMDLPKLQVTSKRFVPSASTE
jgi:hypothetical protein